MALYPAVIREYNAQKRTVRIEMVGMTNGATLLPECDLMYSLGDKSNHTEIEILAGDSVWVDFLADDPRYPIIMGFRNPEMGNIVGWRKWHHANIEIAADGEMVLTGNKLTMNFSEINISGSTTHSGNVSVGGDVSANGVSLQNHTHTGDSGGTTGTPK